MNPSSDTDNEPREPCCIQHDGYPIGADCCGAERDGDGDKTHRCTRPVGHDGAHVACDGEPAHDQTEVWF